MSGLFAHAPVRRTRVGARHDVSPLSRIAPSTRPIRFMRRASRLPGDLSAIFIRSRRNDEIHRQLVELIGRSASFFVLELILRVPKLCSWLDAVHEHQTHHQEISA
jgi:hypothetical protein